MFSSSTELVDKNYSAAIKLLNSLQSNVETLDEIKRKGGRTQERSLPEMYSILTRGGIEPADLNALNAIHITGTKGKGSTCIFVESILQEGGYRTGTFTSPHLVEVRERFRLNGKPISHETFATYFFECWDKLATSMPNNEPRMPAYFRFLTYLAFHIFLKEKVDAAVIEVGIGGLHDATNVLVSPFATGVATIGLDHQALLGDTTLEIAAQKGGIYKRGVPAFAVKQGEAELDVLRSTAASRGAPFTVAPDLHSYPALKDIKLGLSGKFQESNASLAVALVLSWMNKRRQSQEYEGTTGCLISEHDLPSFFRTGLENAKWPGRAQLVNRGDRHPRLFIDGAHTEESISVAAEWYSSETRNSKRPKALVFSCTKGRDPTVLLSSLKGIRFSKVLLTSTRPFKIDSNNPRASLPDLIDRSLPSNHKDFLIGVEEAWHAINGDMAVVQSSDSVEEAMNEVDTFGPEYDVLITGSLYLVGGVFAVLGLL